MNTMIDQYDAHVSGNRDGINSIQEFLDVSVDYYVEINMHGLKDLVDAIGGIEITSPLTFEYNGASFKASIPRPCMGGRRWPSPACVCGMMTHKGIPDVSNVNNWSSKQSLINC